MSSKQQKSYTTDNTDCPICGEQLDSDDLNFHPCQCGFQICIWCWNKINEKRSWKMSKMS